MHLRVLLRISAGRNKRMMRSPRLMMLALIPASRANLDSKRDLKSSKMQGLKMRLMLNLRVRLRRTILELERRRSRPQRRVNARALPRSLTHPSLL